MATKRDLTLTQNSFNNLLRDYSTEFPIIIGTSIKKHEFPEDFGETILKVLDKIRIFTMNNGIVADKPLIINRGSSVKDVAIKIHKSFYENFDYAIVVRETAKQKRKRVGLEFEIQEGDIIELHMK